MAFDMMDGIRMLRDPGTGKDVQMRIGCHSGPVVAGIVGMKMPRLVLVYCNNLPIDIVHKVLVTIVIQRSNHCNTIKI